jgi:hypothetical protein
MRLQLQWNHGTGDVAAAGTSADEVDAVEALLPDEPAA